MGYLKARLTDRSEIEFEDQPLNSGGEKVVFFARDRKHVICFFFGKLKDRQERKHRLDKILREYNPTIASGTGDYWKNHFCWPVGVVDGGVSCPNSFLSANQILDPPLAVITPAYRGNFYWRDRTGEKREKEGKWFTSPKCIKLLPEKERGDFRGSLQVCAKMARAVRRMHFAGLAHSDLSNKNVLIDPASGDSCIIDIDSLVVPSVAPPSVLGTPGYIAPEVVEGKALPSIATDRHALAVLIYETLLHRHPLAGPKVHSTLSPEEDERLSKGPKALFVEHPTDHSNHLRPPPPVPVTRMGRYLEKLFYKTFVDGLHQPDRRADASEWEKALYRTIDLIYPCPGGKDWFILGPGMSRQCPYSGQMVSGPVPLVRFYREGRPGHFVNEGHCLTLSPNLVLYRWHTRANTFPAENADPTPQSYIAFHQNKYYLVNQSDEDMYVVHGARIRRGQSMVIERGLLVRCSLQPGERLLSFDFMES
jgi:hypothetical protein